MSETVERVARAIWNEHLCEECVVSSKKPLPADCCCYAAARAAIEAMREPTEAMKDAGLLIGESIEPPPDRVWRAMIDEALKSEAHHPS